MNELLHHFVSFFETTKPTIEFRHALAHIAPQNCRNISEPQDSTECVLNPLLDLLAKNFEKKSLWGITYIRHTVCEKENREELISSNFNEVQNYLNLDLPTKATRITFESLITAFQANEEYPSTFKRDAALIAKCPLPYKLYWQSHIELAQHLAIFAFKRKTLVKYNDVKIILPIKFRGLELNAIICGNGFHYWTYAKRKNNQWFKLDDERVIAIKDIQTVIDIVAENCVLVLYENGEFQNTIEAFGIINGGKNYCYQNSTLQFIVSSLTLTKFIQEYAFIESSKLPKKKEAIEKKTESSKKFETPILQMNHLNQELLVALKAIQNAWEDEDLEDSNFLRAFDVESHRQDLKKIESLIEKHIDVHDKEVENYRIQTVKRRSD